MQQVPIAGVMVEFHERSFRVFYRDYINDVRINSGSPEPLAADRLVSLAEHLLTSEDNFLGVVDDADVVLQIYLDQGQTVVMELLFPEATGCMQCRLKLSDAMELIGKLPPKFADNMLPGANYIG